MSFKHLVLLGLIIIGYPLTALAQNSQSVVAPWSVDNTPAQSQIRQYQNFKSLYNETGANTNQPPANYQYEYAAPNANVTQQASTPQFDTNRKTLNMGIKPSAIETMYSDRIVDDLQQFGYDLFGIPNTDMRSSLNALGAQSPSIPSGAVQDDFVLGQGDELEVVFTGQRADRGTYKVNSQGQLLIPDFPPIPASGRTIGQVRISIEAAAKQLHNTQAFLSLASVRQIGVLVVGHVKRPGRQTLTVFHTALDALMEAGGVQKTGSLRRIKLVRGGRSTFIDLYGLLMHGSTNMDLQLRDGDRLIVPSIGPTVAVAGEAKRTGIFEILPTARGMAHKPEKSSEKLSLNEMLELGGGVLAPGKNRFLKLGVTPKGQEQLEEIHAPFLPQFSDGAILMVSKGQERRAGTVELQGHTLRPGLHALSKNKNLSSLLSSADLLGSDIYPLIGVIERWDGEELSRQLLDFPLKLVLQNKFDRTLKDGDVIHLFSNAQIKQLSATPVAKIQPVSLGSRPEEDLDLIEDETLAGFLRERAAFLRGAVRQPGHYPIAEGISLESVIASAGGLALEANTSNIEVTSSHNGPNAFRQRVNFREDNPKDIIIGPGDSVRVNQKFKKIADNSVLIMGEVKNPGRYDLVPGDKISDLVKRAGGLNEHAYPYGAIFSRASERKAEEARFRAQAREVELAIGAALEADDEKVNAGKIAEARSLASELRNAQGVGRITVEADPGILSTNPELDLLLESGRDRNFC